MFFNKIPTTNEINNITKVLMKKSQHLNQIILKCEWEQKQNVDFKAIEDICCFYILYFYSQVMQVKYSKFYIKTVVRTIFITMEENLKKMGIKVEKNYFLNLYIGLVQTINRLYDDAKRLQLDEFEQVAYYLLIECNMTDIELTLNRQHIEEIAQFFRDIINIDKKDL